MCYYPLFLDLAESKCLVAGLGDVGLRKLATLLECPVREVLALDKQEPVQSAIWPALAQNPAVRFEQREWSKEHPACPADFDRDVMGKSLVFAATGSVEVNLALAACCKAHAVPCNVVNAPDAGTFIVPAQVRSASLHLALSTGGASPALARALKQDLQSWLGDRYTRLAVFLEKIRPHVLALNMGSTANAEVFRAITAQRARLADAMNKHDWEQCQDILKPCLPPALFSCLAELLHELD